MEYEFLSPSDKPALVALSTLEWQGIAQQVLTELGYKVHVVADHTDFNSRFGGVQYQIVITEELFSAATPAENLTLTGIQNMPMNMRRHCAFILIGDNFQTMHPMQAFQQSVHAVVNREDAINLGQYIQKVIGDNDLFMYNFRDTQRRIAEGKV
jgi:hypothetical protein